jgi:hypothetical protein
MLWRTLVSVGFVTFLASLGCRSRPAVRPASEVITLAEGYMVLSEPDAARELYREALRKNPHDGRAMLGLARVALRLGDHERALRELKRAEAGNTLTRSEQDSLHILLGRTYVRMGKPKVAWHYLWPVWRRGDLAVKSSLDTEIKGLARGLPADTPGVGDVVSFRPPPRKGRVTRVRPTPKRRRPVRQIFSITAREHWRPLSPRRNRFQPMGKPWRITIHHSAHDTGPGPDSYAEAAALIRSIQRNHVKDRGWADIGYHFIVDASGRIWEGRPIHYQGAHAGNPTLNAGNIGIVATGNFSVHRPTTEQVASLRWLIRHLRNRYRIPAAEVRGHSAFKPTACPGKYLSRLLPDLR